VSLATGLVDYSIVLPHFLGRIVRVDAVCCYRPSSVVCRSVTLVSPAQMAEAIEMPFELWARMGPRNHVLDGGQIPWKGDNSKRGWGRPALKYCDSVICAKTAEPNEMSFGLRTYALDRVLIPMRRGNYLGRGPTTLCRELCNKCSAVAEITGDRLATIDMAENWGLCPFLGRGLGPHLT